MKKGKKRVVEKRRRDSSKRLDNRNISTAVPDVDDSSPPCFIEDLPDHLLEKILSFVPIPTVVRAKAVSPRWRDLINLKGFPYNEASEPWYFLFRRDGGNSGHVHDPVNCSWYGGLKIPLTYARSCLNSSSNGLVCFMHHNRKPDPGVFLCNPLTEELKRIDGPPRGEFSSCRSVSIYSSPSSPGYKIAVVEARDWIRDGLRPELCIHVYDSTTRSWDTPVKERMVEWYGDTESVICGGVLYCLIYCRRMIEGEWGGRRIIAYDLAKGTTSSLLGSSIPAPCTLTCARLMNLRERMIMVGGIDKNIISKFMEGVGVWELVEREWREISRMPYKFFKRFRRMDHVFMSSGAGDLIYVQRYGAPALTVFDMKTREWRWHAKCPVNKKSSFFLFNGFSFLPRLEISY